MRSFASDNNSSVHPRIMEALMKANNGHALGYGDDPWTEEAAHKVKEQFSRPCEALFVFNGTGSNTMALQIILFLRRKDLVHAYHRENNLLIVCHIIFCVLIGSLT